MNDLKQIETELPKVFPVAVAPPLLQSRARPVSFPRGTVWHGTRIAVPKTTVITSMKPQSHVIRVERPVKLEVVQPIALVLLSQRAIVRKFASFGSREGVIEVLIVSSSMRAPLVNQGRLLLRVQLAVIPKERRSLPGVPRGRTLAAQVAPRVRRTLDLRNAKGRLPVLRHPLLLCL